MKRDNVHGFIGLWQLMENYLKERITTLLHSSKESESGDQDNHSLVECRAVSLSSSSVLLTRK